jgi:hypothetical protein
MSCVGVAVGSGVGVCVGSGVSVDVAVDSGVSVGAGVDVGGVSAYTEEISLEETVGDMVIEVLAGLGLQAGSNTKPAINPATRTKTNQPVRNEKFFWELALNCFSSMVLNPSSVKRHLIILYEI